MCNIQLTDIKDIVAMIVSIAAVIIAFSGLQTWRRKLLGENKYGLSINVIKALRILIDEIENYRNPVRFESEIYYAYKKVVKKDLDPLNQAEKEKALKYAHNLRWNKVMSTYIEYDSKMLHLKVLLDKYDIDVVNNETMTTLLKNLRYSVDMHDSYLKLLNDRVDQSPDERSNYMRIINEHSLITMKMDSNNEFTKIMEFYFNEINKRLRKYFK